MNDYRIYEKRFLKFITNTLYYFIKDIPRHYFVSKLSSTQEDMKMGFDINFGNIEVAVRLRTSKYMFFNDVSIRCYNNGFRTEIDKLIDGLGGLYFYGWLNEEETIIMKFVIYDIDPIRQKLLTNGKQNYNRDGTCGRYYSLDFLKENGCIIAACEYDIESNKYKKIKLNNEKKA
jgi:hypothetical protein